MDRKPHEHTLHHTDTENGSLLDAALDCAGVLAWKYEPQTHRFIAAGSARKKYGLPEILENVPEALIQSGHVAADSLADLREQFDAVDRGLPDHRELHVFMPDGSELWARVSYLPIPPQDGRPAAAIGTAVDITVQKQKEFAYAEHLRFKKVFAANTMAICLYDLSRNSIVFTEGGSAPLPEKLLSATPDVLIDAIRSSSSVADARHPNLSRKALLDAFRHGETHFEIRFCNTFFPSWTELSADLMENPFTHSVEAFCAFRDATDFVRTEQVAERLFQMTYDSIFLINAETGVALPYSANSNTAVIEEQERVGEPVAGLDSYLRKHCVDPDIDRVCEEANLPNVTKKLQSQTVFSLTFSLRENGRICRKRAEYTYLDSSRTTILCAMQDITETVRQEDSQRRRLELSLRMAEAASKAKADFLATMSHDLRAPLSGILGLASLMRGTEDLAEIRNGLDEIRISGRYLLRLVCDALDMNSIESNRLVLYPKPMVLQYFFRNAESTAHRFAADHNINLDWQARIPDKVMHMTVMGDESRLAQILMNLLSNAMQFTSEGDTVSLTAEALLWTDEAITFRCTVVDNGGGMSEEFLPHLFEPFSQEAQIRGEHRNISGLGMCISKHLVDMMHGSIDVESTLGKGSRIAVTLSLPRSQEEVFRRARRKTDPALLAGKTVLLCEDHPINRQVAERLLTKIGVHVHCVCDGASAVEFFRNSAPGSLDAVLMDLRMPVMDGLTATAAIRALDRPNAKTIPIIAMTASAFEEDIRRCMEAGMNAHIAKPYAPDALYYTLADELQQNAAKK